MFGCSPAKVETLMVVLIGMCNTWGVDMPMHSQGA
jgi:hypothetical protein